ncbi:hypothetical protein MMC20_001550, partial [Loxospora ochrophaea]|nr:hypothetical protein [Loxospora ochrophaea]
NTPQPPELQLVKYYYKFHLEEVKARFENARELGPGAAEEWIKGLEREGRERIDDAARWEHYEAKGGLKKINSRPNPKNAAPLSSLSHESVDASPGADVSSNRSAPYGLIYGGNQPGDNSPSISN